MPSNRWINTVESLDCRAESDAIGQYTKAHNDNIMVTIHAYRFYLDRMLARNPFCCGPGGVCGEGKKTTVNKQPNWKKSARKTEGSTWSARHMPESIEQCGPKKALNGVDLHANIPAHHAQMFEHFGISFFPKHRVYARSTASESTFLCIRLAQRSGKKRARVLHISCSSSPNGKTACAHTVKQAAGNQTVSPSAKVLIEIRFSD